VAAATAVAAVTTVVQTLGPAMAAKDVLVKPATTIRATVATTTARQIRLAKITPVATAEENGSRNYASFNKMDRMARSNRAGRSQFVRQRERTRRPGR
jgi:hypothetical protein